MRTDIPPAQLAFGDQIHATFARSVDSGVRYARLITDLCDDDMISMVYLYTKLMELKLAPDNALMSLSLALVRLSRAERAT